MEIFQPFAGSKNEAVAQFRRWILAEVEDVLFINKPAGILSQPDEHSDWGIAEVGSAALGIKLFPIHRLDRNVSGVLVLAKTKSAAADVGARFKDRSARKFYRAVAINRRKVPESPSSRQPWPEQPWRIVRDITLKSGEIVGAESEFEVLGSRRGLAGLLVDLRLKPITGRTHQLRIHLQQEQLHLMGDPRHGFAVKGVYRPLLHCERLELGGTLSADAPVPWSLEQLVTLKRL